MDLDLDFDRDFLDSFEESFFTLLKLIFGVKLCGVWVPLLILMVGDAGNASFSDFLVDFFDDSLAV